MAYQLHNNLGYPETLSKDRARKMVSCLPYSCRIVYYIDPIIVSSLLLSWLKLDHRSGRGLDWRGNDVRRIENNLCFRGT